MKFSNLKEKREMLSLCAELLVKHMEALVEAGAALRKIRDGKLYQLAGRRTMKKYCMAHYAMTKKAWEGLIEIAEIRDQILDTIRLRQATEEGQ